MRRGKCAPHQCHVRDDGCGRRHGLGYAAGGVHHVVSELGAPRFQLSPLSVGSAGAQVLPPNRQALQLQTVQLKRLFDTGNGLLRRHLFALRLHEIRLGHRVLP